MWLLKNAGRRQALNTLMTLGCVAALSACSFTPLYGDTSAVGTGLELRYAEPNSRLEQIIYQDLKLRLGRKAIADAPLVSITASAASRRIGRTSSSSPATTYEATVTANATVTELDSTTGATKTIYTVSRAASATYTTNDQRLADQQAIEDANERAALAVARTLRLLLATQLPDKR